MRSDYASQIGRSGLHPEKLDNRSEENVGKRRKEAGLRCLYQPNIKLSNKSLSNGIDRCFYVIA